MSGRRSDCKLDGSRLVGGWRRIHCGLRPTGRGLWMHPHVIFNCGLRALALRVDDLLLPTGNMAAARALAEACLADSVQGQVDNLFASIDPPDFEDPSVESTRQSKRYSSLRLSTPFTAPASRRSSCATLIDTCSTRREWFEAITPEM